MVNPPTDSASVGTRGRAQGHRVPRSADRPCGGHRESNQRMEDPVCWEAMVKGKRSGKPHGAWRPVGQRVWLRPHGEGAADGGAHLQGETTYISQ